VAAAVVVVVAAAGWRDLEAGQGGEAAAKLERAVALDPAQADWGRTSGPRGSGSAGWMARSTRTTGPAQLQPRDQKRQAELLGATGYRRQAAGDLDGATRDYRKAVTADPRQAWIWYNLGTALTAKGEAGEAAAAFQRAARLDAGGTPRGDDRPSPSGDGR
jgi:Tfp pilus assembly protein PilF